MSNKSRQIRAERAAALLAERERAEKRRQTLTVVGVVLGLVLVVAGGFLINRMRDTTGNVVAIDTGGAYEVTVGTADAPRDVVIYEDFLCPFCGELEAQTREELAGLAESGQVRVTYRPFVLLDQLGDYSQRSTAAFGVVLDQAGPDVAKAFHDLLFENQPAEEGPFPDDDRLVDLAVEAGADESEVRGPIEDLAGADFAQGATDQAIEAGVQGTPTILVDGEVWQDYRSLDDIGANLIGALSR